jgi:DNA-binding transcriptional LysR family regulator
MEGLERFSVTVKNRLDVRIGAGDRLIHWILLPRLAQVQSRLPTVHITLFNLQTPEVIKALKNRSIDLGLIRTSALIEPLRAFPLQTLQYGFFVPMKILERLPPEQRKNARYIMENAPVAVQGIESEIHTRLRDFAQADNVKLNIKLCCESYPQSFRAIASDGYCGFLPLPAEQDLDPIRVIRLPTPFLSLPTTEIALVHHPDLHELLALPGRPSFQSVITCFERVYRDSGTPRN